MKDAELTALAREQESQRGFIAAMMQTTGWSASHLAKSAGLAHTTISRFLSRSDATHCLSARTLSKLDNAARNELARRYGSDVREWPEDMAYFDYVSRDALIEKSQRLARPPSNLSLPEASSAILASADERSGVSAAHFVSAPDIQALPKNFPVRGIALGGSGGEFTFNGTDIDIVRRPLALVGVDNAFAVYVAGDSMAPRFEPGELLFIHPGRPPKPGDDVLVELYGKDGDPGACYLKRLVRRGGGKAVLAQFNPPREIRIDLDKIRAIHKVLTRAELQ
jgi:phage repressor protein C with HTH and peptisase S24 domain